jgi:hypothetical protein
VKKIYVVIGLVLLIAIPSTLYIRHWKAINDINQAMTDSTDGGQPSNATATGKALRICQGFISHRERFCRPQSKPGDHPHGAKN